jgi:hypothetical protein
LAEPAVDQHEIGPGGVGWFDFVVLSLPELGNPLPLRERVADEVGGVRGIFGKSEQGPLTRLAALATLSLKGRG